MLLSMNEYKFKPGDRVWYVPFDDMIRGATIFRVMSPPTSTRDTLYELTYGTGVEERYLIKQGTDKQMDTAMRIIAETFENMQSIVKCDTTGLILP